MVSIWKQETSKYLHALIYLDVSNNLAKDVCVCVCELDIN